jgi:conjugal transfer ATP-binding protein TraC
MQDRVLYTFNMIYPDHESQRGKVERDKAWTTRQVDGQLARYIPAWGERLRALTITADAINEGDRMVKGYLGMVVFGRDNAEVTKASVSLQGSMREQGFQVLEDAWFIGPLFSQLLPFSAAADMEKQLMRYRNLPTRSAASLLPIFGGWGGTRTPLLTLISRDGQLMPLSPNDSDSNMNFVIAAKSGAGKSFLSNELISNYLSIGGRVWIIDKGFSYKNLTNLLGGTFIEFDEGMELSLNPFGMVKSWDEESDIVASVLQVMAAPKEGLTDFQHSQLKRVAEATYREFGNDATVKNVADALLAEEDPRLNDVGHQLYPFTEGEYSKFFNGKQNCDLSNRLVVLELQNLSGRQHLQRVALLLLMYQIQFAMDSLPRDVPKLLLVDEAFGLLASNETASFLNNWYRQLRKFGASAGICTQSINDLYQNAGSLAIVENSAHKWFLSQDPESIAVARKEGRIQMSEAELMMLESVFTVRGEMSEIMVRSPYGTGIGRLVVSDFCKLLYSTTAQEVEAIKTYRRQGMTLEGAINALVRDRSKAK